MDKKCSKCGEVQVLSQFRKDARNRSGYGATCKACASEYMKTYYSTTSAGIYNRLRDSASSQYKPFHISSDEFADWWARQKQECHYCEQALTLSKSRTHKLTDKTFDRKNSTKGYILDNIVLSCRRCNLMKGNWLTYQQTLEIAQRYFKS